ncbi:MAG: phage virion morphogenesis protein [Azoarcus sp.]|nr:phage virion morphogenesis protein [Azoarcus sp.]
MRDQAPAVLQNELEFGGKAGRIAAVHHFGLRDNVVPGSKEVTYAARPLLGFSRDDLEALENLLLDHVAAGLR